MTISIISTRPPATDTTGERTLHDRLPKAALIEDDVDDKPFRMSALNLAESADIQEMADSLQVLGGGAGHTPLYRNRFFGGVCLALPLSAMLWYLFYQCLRYLTD